MTIERSPLTGRARVDLRRSMPRWALFALSAAVIAAVAGAAWWIGRDQPVPAWITRYLVPSLGWIYIGLAVVALAGYWQRRRARRRTGGGS